MYVRTLHACRFIPEWVILWRLNPLDEVNVSPLMQIKLFLFLSQKLKCLVMISLNYHSSQTIGAALCSRMLWAFKASPSLNFPPHWVHSYFFTFSWTLSTWAFNNRLKTNTLPQMGHSCLSGMWQRILCAFLASGSIKASSHWSHLKGLSPVWLRICLKKYA